MDDKPPLREPFASVRVAAQVVRVALSLLVVVLVAGVFLYLTMRRGHREAYKVQCTGNLSFLYSLSLDYSLKKGSGYFPIAPGALPRAHGSLNELVSYLGGSIPPNLFACPEGEAVPADADSAGLFVLGEKSLSYAWTAKPLSNEKAGASLASDKYVDGYTDADGVHAGHLHGMNVVMSDGAITFIDEKDLPPDTLLPSGLTR